LIKEENKAFRDSIKADDVNLQKETLVKLTIDNENKTIIEKNVEFIGQEATTAVAEQQKLRTEVVNVDTIRSLNNRHVDQQIDVRRFRKLKNRT
jgi:hypothetical protein